MTLTQGPSSAAGEWMSKIADLFASPDKNLDQVKKSVQADLEKLRGSTDVATSLYSAAAEGFKRDLEEVNITGDAQAEYLRMFEQKWREMQMGKKSAEMLNSPELSAMDAFITNLQNLPKLKAIIDSAEPQAGWQGLIGKITNKIPGLGDFVKNGGFDTILTSLGLGFLVQKKKEKETPNTPVSTTSATGNKDGNKKPDAPQDDKEKPRQTPNATLLMGDSITVGVPSHGRNIFKISGRLDCIAKGGESSGWGVGEAHKLASSWKDEKVTPPENAVILFGTNDLLGSPDKIISNLQEIYRTLYKAGVKRVYAVTIPPHEGYKRYDNTSANKNRHIVNDWILGRDPNRPKPNYVHRVIDLCKEKKDGGLATNGNAERLDKDVTGDNLHIVKEELAKVYQRELEIGSAEPDKTYPNE